VVTNVSKKPAASTFRMDLKVEVTDSSEVYLTTYITHKTAIKISTAIYNLKTQN
jgi:hypothetical protein